MVFAKAAKKRTRKSFAKWLKLLVPKTINYKKILRTSKLKLFIGGIGIIMLMDVLIATKSSLFTIAQIKCQENKQTCDQTIQIDLTTYEGQNLLLLDSQSLKRNLLNNFPQITAVTVRKQLPATLEVMVAQRQAIAMVLDGQGKYFFVDKDHKAYLEAYDPKLPLIKTPERISLGIQLVSPNILQALIISQALEESLLPVRQIKVLFQDHLEAELFSGQRILFAGNKDVVAQVDSLLFILQHEDKNQTPISTIDLRFDNPVIK